MEHQKQKKWKNIKIEHLSERMFAILIPRHIEVLLTLYQYYFLFFFCLVWYSFVIMILVSSIADRLNAYL